MLNFLRGAREVRGRRSADLLGTVLAVVVVVEVLVVVGITGARDEGQLRQQVIFRLGEHRGRVRAQAEIGPAQADRLDQRRGADIAAVVVQVVEAADPAVSVAFAVQPQLLRQLVEVIQHVVVEDRVRRNVGVLAVSLLRVQVIGDRGHRKPVRFADGMHRGAIHRAVEDAAPILRLIEGVRARIGVAEEVGAAGKKHAAAGRIGHRGGPGIVARDFGVVVDSMQLQAHLAVVGEFPGELHAAGELPLVVDAAAEVVGDVAFVIVGRKGGAGGEGVGQRAADGAFGVDAAEVAAGDIQIAIETCRSADC